MEMSITGLDEGIDWCKRAEHEIPDQAQVQFVKMLEAIVAEARSNLQNNRNIVSGNLHASVQILSLGYHEGTVGTMVAYAVYIEYGRGPVRPVNAKVLRWVDPATGKVIFSHYAKEFIGVPFMEPAIITESQDFAEECARVIAERLS